MCYEGLLKPLERTGGGHWKRKARTRVCMFSCDLGKETDCIASIGRGAYSKP